MSQYNREDKHNKEAGTAEQILQEMHEEIAPEATPLWTFVNDNAPKIVAIVVSVVVIIIGIAFYQGYQESALEEAKLELAIINSNNDNAKRLAELETFRNNAPTEIFLAIELEIARTAILLNDISKAENAYAKAREIEGDSALGLSIAVNLADIFARQGQAQKSLEIYESILSDIPSEFQVAIYANIGDLALSANLTEKAKEAYTKALEILPESEKDSIDADYFRRKLKQLS